MFKKIVDKLISSVLKKSISNLIDDHLPLQRRLDWSEKVLGKEYPNNIPSRLKDSDGRPKIFLQGAYSITLRELREDIDEIKVVLMGKQDMKVKKKK